MSLVQVCVFLVLFGQEVALKEDKLEIVGPCARLSRHFLRKQLRSAMRKALGISAVLHLLHQDWSMGELETSQTRGHLLHIGGDENHGFL